MILSEIIEYENQLNDKKKKVLFSNLLAWPFKLIGIINFDLFTYVYEP